MTAIHLPVNLNFLFYSIFLVIRDASSFHNCPGLYSVKNLENDSVLIKMYEDLRLYQLMLIIFNVYYICI